MNKQPQKNHDWRKSIRNALILSLIGVIITGISGHSVIKFVLTSGEQHRPSVQEFVTRLIIPHMFLLVGLGLATTGVILIIRQNIIRKRIASNADLTG